MTVTLPACPCSPVPCTGQVDMIPWTELDVDPVPRAASSTADVFKARWCGREVALKKLRVLCDKGGQSQSTLAELIEAVQALCRLNHPNIARLFGLSTAPDSCAAAPQPLHRGLPLLVPWPVPAAGDTPLLLPPATFTPVTVTSRSRDLGLVVEWCACTLAGWPAPRDADEAMGAKCQIASDMCNALAFLHRKNILHRDIRPSN
eukprot:gene3908-4281_t